MSGNSTTAFQILHYCKKGPNAKEGGDIKSPPSFLIGTEDWTRTSTLVRALPPQGSVSTNFTTSAGGGILEASGSVSRGDTPKTP